MVRLEVRVPCSSAFRWSVRRLSLAAALALVAGCGGGMVNSPQTPETIAAQARLTAEALGGFEQAVCIGPVRDRASGAVVPVGADPQLDLLLEALASRLAAEDVPIVPPSASRSALASDGRAGEVLVAGEAGVPEDRAIPCPVVLTGEVIDDRLVVSSVRMEGEGPTPSATAWLVWKRRAERVAAFGETFALLGPKDRAVALTNYLRRHPGRVTHDEFRALLESCGRRDRAAILEIVEDEQLLHGQQR